MSLKKVYQVCKFNQDYGIYESGFDESRFDESGLMRVVLMYIGYIQAFHYYCLVLQQLT